MNTTCSYVHVRKVYSYTELTLTSRSSVAARKASEPPRFVERLDNLNVKENEPFEFVAESTGHPPPMMSWQKDGRHIDRFVHDVMADCIQKLNFSIRLFFAFGRSLLPPDVIRLLFSGIRASAFATKVIAPH